MTDLVITYLTIGTIFLVGLLIDCVGRSIRVPRVSLLILTGFVIGPALLDLLPDLAASWFRGITDIALMMIGFLLGGQLTLKTLRQHGRAVMLISISVVILTALVVTLLAWLAGAPLPLALLLGAIATATDPAATEDVVQETGARGPFTQTLLGIVAIDDAWGLILFSLVLTVVGMLAGGEPNGHLWSGLYEVGGAVVLGVGLGIPMAYLTGRIHDGEPTLVEALGFVLLCGGIAIYLELSFILAAMTMGMTVVNLASHHDRPFHAIEGIEWPFKLMFFLLAGASLELNALEAVGWLGLAYILGRTGGRLAGGMGGTLVAGHHQRNGHWMGLSLMPQAGIAIGMALTAQETLPASVTAGLMPIVVGSTVLFELLGPLLTRMALKRTNEIPD